MKKTFERKTVITVFGTIMGTLIMACLIGLAINPTGSQFEVVDHMYYVFADFFDPVIWAADRNPYIGKPAVSVYLPFCYLLLYPFSCLDTYSSMPREYAFDSPIGMFSCFIYLFISLTVLYFSLYKLGQSKRSTLFILVLLFFSHVNLYSVERSNLVILAAGLVTAFLFLYDSPKKSNRILALVFLSIAAVLKIYPAILGLLLLFDKRYKSIAFCLLLGIVLTFAPFAFLHHGFFENMEQLVANLTSFSEGMGVFGLPRILSVVQRYVNLPAILFPVFKCIQLLLLAMSIVICFFTKDKWLKIALLTICVIMLPAYSAFYCGLYFFPAIVLFFNKQTYNRKDILYVLLFCVFLNPFQLFFIGDAPNQVVSKCALLAIWGLLLVDGVKEVKLRAYLNKLLHK